MAAATSPAVERWLNSAKYAQPLPPDWLIGCKDTTHRSPIPTAARSPSRRAVLIQLFRCSAIRWKGIPSRLVLVYALSPHPHPIRFTTLTAAFLCAYPLPCTSQPSHDLPYLKLRHPSQQLSQKNAGTIVGHQIRLTSRDQRKPVAIQVSKRGFLHHQVTRHPVQLFDPDDTHAVCV